MGGAFCLSLGEALRLAALRNCLIASLALRAI
jgi:hypothetical protein